MKNPYMRIAESLTVLSIAGLSVHETIGGEPGYRQKMLELYPHFFPEYSYYLPYMAYRMEQSIDSDPGFVERWWLVEVEGVPAALRLFKYSPGRNCALVLGMAVKPEFRKVAVEGYDRLSEFIVDLSADQIRADAEDAGRPVPAGFSSEFQFPEPTMPEEEQRFHQHIIDRYREIGYIGLPVEYYEPPHIIGRENFILDAAYTDLPYHRMLLSILPIAGGHIDLEDRQMITDFTLAYLTDHYRLPEDHWAVRRALDSIESHYRKLGHD